MPTPALGPSGLSSVVLSVNPRFSTALMPPRSVSTIDATSRPPLTQAAILRMGHLAYFADVRASRLEVAVPGMIESTLAATVTPLRESIDALTSRIKVC